MEFRKKDTVYQFHNVTLEGKSVTMLANSFKIALYQKNNPQSHGSINMAVHCKDNSLN